MLKEEEIWSETGVGTRISTRNATEQSVLVVVVKATGPAPASMATRKGVYSCCGKEIGENGSRPCERKEMDVEGVHGDQSTEGINEECEEDHII